MSEYESIDQSFFSVFRNKYIRSLIFNNIRQFNQNLKYLTYNYYTFPLISIIKNKNHHLLNERLNLLNNIIENNQTNTITTTTTNNNNDHFKYYLEINFDCILQIFKWKEINFDLFKLFYATFLYEINQQFKNNETSNDRLMVSIENFGTLTYVMNQNSTQPIIHNSSILQEFTFPTPTSSDTNVNESIKRFKILIDLIKQNGDTTNANTNNMIENESLFKLLEIIVEKKLSKQFAPMVLEKIGLFEVNQANKKLLKSIIEYSDEFMFVEVLKVLKCKYEKIMAIDPYETKITVYGIQVPIKIIEKYSIDPVMLMKSKMLKLISIMISLPENFIHKLRPHCGTIIIRDPLVAQFVSQSSLFNQIILGIQFSPACILDDLTNAPELFKKIPRKCWRLVSSKHQTIDKFQLFIDHGINGIECIFNNSNYRRPIMEDDLALIQLYCKHFTKPTLSLLKSSVRQNLKQIVNWLLDNYWESRYRELVIPNNSYNSLLGFNGSTGGVGGVGGVVGNILVSTGYYELVYLLELSVIHNLKQLFTLLHFQLELQTIDLIKSKNDSIIKEPLYQMYTRLLSIPPCDPKERFKFFQKLSTLPWFNQFLSLKSLDYKGKIHNHHLPNLKLKLSSFILLNLSNEIGLNYDGDDGNQKMMDKIEFYNILYLCIRKNWIQFIDTHLKVQLLDFGRKKTFRKKLANDLFEVNTGFILYLISIGFFGVQELDYICERLLYFHSSCIKLIDFILYNNLENVQVLMFQVYKVALKYKNNSLLHYLLLKFQKLGCNFDFLKNHLNDNDNLNLFNSLNNSGSNGGIIVGGIGIGDGENQLYDNLNLNLKF